MARDSEPSGIDQAVVALSEHELRFLIGQQAQHLIWGLTAGVGAYALLRKDIREQIARMSELADKLPVPGVDPRK